MHLKTNCIVLSKLKGLRKIDLAHYRTCGEIMQF
uniref:Uncharacterized protein n=1 Tax=Anguilla anguilla TaxID=7936 RepID=A0A0E9S892_ANGAN